jgi:hypothetical protein
MSGNRSVGWDGVFWICSDWAGFVIQKGWDGKGGLGCPIFTIYLVNCLSRERMNGMDGQQMTLRLLAWCWMSSSIVAPSRGCRRVRY